MSKKGGEKEQGSIRPYLARTCKEAESEKEKDNRVDTSAKPVQSKMATAQQIQDMVDRLGDKMDNRFTQMEETVSKNIQALSDKFDSIEFDVNEVKEKLEKTTEETAMLREEMNDLKRQVLTHQAYGRKYNLLLYGVQGHETDAVETIKVVRKFARDSLKLSAETAANLAIRNAHRLKKNHDEERPAAIIVVFMYWPERRLFLESAKNLRNTKMSVRTDLPLPLKIHRSKLAGIAYNLRKEGHFTRIMERIPDVWLETRSSAEPGASWKKWEGEVL